MAGAGVLFKAVVEIVNHAFRKAPRDSMRPSLQAYADAAYEQWKTMAHDAGFKLKSANPWAHAKAPAAAAAARAEHAAACALAHASVARGAGGRGRRKDGGGGCGGSGDDGGDDDGAQPIIQ